MPECSISSIRSLIFGLLTKCPFDNNSSINCPMHELRKLSLIDKFEYMENLPQKKCIDLYTKHKQCLKSKEL